MKIENICGTTLEIYYDDRYECIDLELVKVFLSKEDKEGHYQIHLEATLKDKKFKNLLKLHIKDAIELKSIIDNLVYDANQDNYEKLVETQTTPIGWL